MAWTLISNVVVSEGTQIRHLHAGRAYGFFGSKREAQGALALVALGFEGRDVSVHKSEDGIDSISHPGSAPNRERRISIHEIGEVSALT